MSKFSRYGIVYKITNIITNNIYIGITTHTLEHRWKEHCACKEDRMLSLAIVKFGKENFKVEEIYTSFSSKDLNEKEKYFIELYSCISPKGYNMTTGGHHFKHSEKTKQLISDRCKGREAPNKGVPMREDLKLNLSQKLTGRQRTEETRNKMSESKKGKKPNNYGKKASPERLAKMKQYKASDETKEKLKLTNKSRKPILCITNNTTYNSIDEASKALNVSIKTIKSRLKGNTGFCKLEFKFIDPSHNYS